MCKLHDNSSQRGAITFEERQQQDHPFEMWCKHLRDAQSAFSKCVKHCSEHGHHTEWIATLLCSINDWELWYLQTLFCECWQWCVWTADAHRRSDCWGSSCVPLRPDLAPRCTASSHSLVHLGNSAGSNRAWVWKSKTKKMEFVCQI